MVTFLCNLPLIGISEHIFSYLRDLLIFLLIMYKNRSIFKNPSSEPMLSTKKLTKMDYDLVIDDWD